MTVHPCTTTTHCWEPVSEHLRRCAWCGLQEEAPATLKDGAVGRAVSAKVAMTQIPKCPSCGRRPSERTSSDPYDPYTAAMVSTGTDCSDPIHDAADLGPALADALREWRTTEFFPTQRAWQQWIDEFRPRVDDLLAALVQP